MKKLKLRALNLDDVEVLTKEQLKEMLGGDSTPIGSIGGDGHPTCYCCSDSDPDNCSAGRDLSSQSCDSLQSAQSACEAYTTCGSDAFIKGACAA